MKSIIKKLFYRPAWVIACRKIEQDQELIPNKSQTSFSVLLPTEKEWYADSFCFADREKVYVFMEIMGRNGSKGTLGVTEFKDGSFSKVVEILREPFHLSYPNVFKYNNHYYMIPETNESNQIRLYESKKFPFEWELKKILFDDVKLVDSSFMSISDDEYIVFSHDINDDAFKLRVFILNLKDLTLREINKFKQASDERPGGNIIIVNGEKFRVLQDCSEYYGRRLKLYKITECNIESMTYSEEYYDDITIDKIPVDIKKPFDRIHTITRSGDYEAIDSLYSRFYITKPFRRIKEKLLIF